MKQPKLRDSRNLITELYKGDKTKRIKVEGGRNRGKC